MGFPSFFKSRKGNQKTPARPGFFDVQICKWANATALWQEANKMWTVSYSKAV